MITIIHTTSDTREELEILGHDLVEQRLAACAQIEGPITSTYIWEDEVRDSEEYRLTLKTLPDKAQQVEDYILSQHSYDTPEIIHSEAKASKDYEAWMAAETS